MQQYPAFGAERSRLPQIDYGVLQLSNICQPPTRCYASTLKTCRTNCSCMQKLSATYSMARRPAALPSTFRWSAPALQAVDQRSSNLDPSGLALASCMSPMANKAASNIINCNAIFVSIN